MVGTVRARVCDRVVDDPAHLAGVIDQASARQVSSSQAFTRLRRSPIRGRDNEPHSHRKVGLGLVISIGGGTTHLASLTIIFQSVAASPLLSYPTMLPRSPRPRAADDFAVIRARELRRERAQPAENERRPATAARPHAISSRPAPANRRNLQDVMRRLMSR
jgi:hypothetical protein